MREIKRFRELSRRQKNRRLKQMQISENFIPQIVNSLNQKASNSLIDRKIYNDVSQLVLDNNISNDLSENIVTNAAIKQSNVVHISTFSISSEREHMLSNNKQISLREKLILWTDEHKIG